MEIESLWDEAVEVISSPDVDEDFITYIENDCCVGCNAKGETSVSVDDGSLSDGSIINILFRLWEKQR